MQKIKRQLQKQKLQKRLVKNLGLVFECQAIFAYVKSQGFIANKIILDSPLVTCAPVDPMVYFARC